MSCEKDSTQETYEVMKRAFFSEGLTIGSREQVLTWILNDWAGTDDITPNQSHEIIVRIQEIIRDETLK